MKILRSIDRVIAKIEGWLIIIFLALMVTLTFSQVMLRALFTHARFQWANFILGHVDWSEPLARLLVLWITFLGASLLTRENKHIKIDLLPAVIPPKWLPYRELILSIGCVVICAFMLKASLGYIKLELDFGGYLFLKLPTWAGQLILPAGFLMILFRFLIRGMEQLLGIFRGSRI
jgi:TRAP-type C4-dicarboxylate transport system permease small subunit